MLTYVVVEHEQGCSIDRFEPWLGAESRFDVRRPYTGEPLGDLTGADALVVLGGEIGANDDAVAPWLPQVRAMLREAVERSLPTLGICLGAQLLAVACDGRVEVGAAGMEVGVVDLDWRPEAAQDALLSGLPSPFPSPAMHNDAIVELPPGAVWLASTPSYPHQAFRIGALAWGVQSHPEVSPAAFAGWCAHESVVSGDAAVAQMTARAAEVSAAGEALARRFAGIVAAVAGGAPAGVTPAQPSRVAGGR